MGKSYFQEVFCNPGITRDGTQFDSKTYIDGKWVRFYKNRPKKIGGYREIYDDSPEAVRTLATFTQGQKNYIVMGTCTSVLIGILDENNNVVITKDVTPEFALHDGANDTIVYTPFNIEDPTEEEEAQFESDQKRIWTFDFITTKTMEQKFLDTNKKLILDPIDSASFALFKYAQWQENTGRAKSFLLAHVAPKLGNINNIIPGPLYALDLELLGSLVLNSDNGEFEWNGNAKLTPVYDYQKTFSKLQAGNLNPQDVKLGITNPAVNPFSEPAGLSAENPLPHPFPAQKMPILATISTTLTATPPSSYYIPLFATGGVTVIGSYIALYGAEGFIRWNNGKNLNAWSTEGSTGIPKNIMDIAPTLILGGGDAIFGSDTFLEGAPARSGEGLSGVFWSTTGVVIPKLADPGFSVITPEVRDADGNITTREVLSKNVNFSFSYASTLSPCISGTSIISAEPNFFWVGLDTFYRYNGGVEEIINETNKLFFFNSLNKEYSSKIYSFVNLQYHEWWILFPKGSAIECDHAIIYNYEHGYWYDTEINRIAALRESGFIKTPILSAGESVIFLKEEENNEGNTVTRQINKFSIFAHETGLNAEYLNGSIDSIESYFTLMVSKELGQEVSTRALVIDKIVFDIEQKEIMSVTLGQRAYPRSSPITTNFFFGPKEIMRTLNNKATILDITFSSNMNGGDYLMGKTFIEYVVTGDEREQPS